MKGIFTISLDFELHWCGFEKWPLEDYKEYFMNTRLVFMKCPTNSPIAESTLPGRSE